MGYVNAIHTPLPLSREDGDTFDYDFIYVELFTLNFPITILLKFFDWLCLLWKEAPVFTYDNDFYT